jgi:ribosomal protein L7/L12
MSDINDAVIVAAIEFIRRVQAEMGELGQEKVFAMLDAFDPNLRDQMIMTLFIHGDDMPIEVRVQKSANFLGQYQKITAIKWVRAATSFGLREAKDVIDEADAKGRSERFEVKNLDSRMNLIKGLQDTGYELA